MTKTKRWQMRAQSYEKAFQRLKAAVAQKKYSDLEVAGLVQTFNFTFELGWKTLKDLLQEDGFKIASPREAIKQAFQSNYIADGELWLDALEKRNIMTHIYDEDEAEIVIELIKEKYFLMLNQLSNFLKQK